MPISRLTTVHERPQHTREGVEGQVSQRREKHKPYNQFQTFHGVYGRAPQPTIGLFDGNRLADAVGIYDSQLLGAWHVHDPTEKRKSQVRKRSVLFRKEAVGRLCLGKKHRSVTAFRPTGNCA